MTNAPDVVWPTDVTVHRTDQGMLYCGAMKDLFSNRTVGHSCSDRIAAVLATSAPRSPVTRREPDFAR